RRLGVGRDPHAPGCAAARAVAGGRRRRRGARGGPGAPGRRPRHPRRGGGHRRGRRARRRRVRGRRPPRRRPLSAGGEPGHGPAGAARLPVVAATSSDEGGRLYPVARAVLSPVFRGRWRMRVEGLEHGHTEGGVIFCPYRVSVLDSCFLPLALPRQIKLVGKAEYMDSWKTRRLFPALGMIPIDRGGGSAAERALSPAARVLEEGGYFGIYPEGTRSRDGRLHRGHTGPARLALRTGCPIVPVGLIGTREVQPPDARLPRPFKPVVVRFGRPIDVRRHADRADDRLVLRQI